MRDMTIKDIAKNCSVSVSTVSRVLNHHPDVSEEVRQRVLDEVERCAYIPNNSARDLVRTRSDAIGVIVRGNGNLFFSSVLKTVSDEIERCGYTMVLHYIGSDADEVKAGAILEREKKLQGLLFLEGSTIKTKRTMDIMEMDVREITHNKSFQLDRCLDTIRIEAQASSLGVQYSYAGTAGYN